MNKTAPSAAEKESTKEPARSPSYRREAELIVQEENEAKKQMPVYKGLEKFKLLEKMGEYVYYLVSFALSAECFHSGAFSNVYKALDLSSGLKVAGMHSYFMKQFAHTTPILVNA